MLVWHDLINSFIKTPRDIHTVPTDKRKPLWFYVNVIENQLVVSAAQEHLPSSKIKGQRKLNQKEFAPMLELYLKRLEGFPVSKKASAITYHQVYWYGIFADML